ncbi:hypothetical protein AMETH_1248 [Amycolatopsis methanolica 239]|uniref:Uncharacterized protein n=1 Tax=Amycolatopsis methanolica 239 TaxID=1068978 RepID=A0A076MR49_AMYME|nr:hypothetical protein AMETH_1248 [Amycolatopsis methanolica 239]
MINDTPRHPHCRRPSQISALKQALVPPRLVLATHWNPPRGYLPAPDDQASVVLLGTVGRVLSRT